MPSQKSRQCIPSKANYQSGLGKPPEAHSLQAVNKFRRNAIVFGIIVSWTVFPIACVLLVAIVSGVCGCSVNEGSPTPCIVFGTDIGRMLYTLGVMGWLSIVTLPTGAIAFLAYLAFLLIERSIARSRQSRADHPDSSPSP
jgi:hypothetical protein